MAEDFEYADKNAACCADGEVSADEKAHVAKWNKIVKAAWDGQEWYRKAIIESRKYVAGATEKKSSIESDRLVRANLMFAEIKAEVNRIYARNPEVTVRPAKAVGDERYGEVKVFGETCETLLNRQAADGGLKETVKAVIRSASTTRIGWLKMIYQKDYAADPLIENRINDIQDNIAGLEDKARRLDGAEDAANIALRRAEAESLMRSLERGLEVVKAEGLVFDHVYSEHILLDTTQVRSIHDYKKAPWICHVVPMMVEDVEARFGIRVEGKKGYKIRKANEGEDNTLKPMYGDKDKIDAGEYIHVMEVWSKKDSTVYTFAEGGREWLVQPYAPDRQGSRWYPFFPYSSNQIDGSFFPMSTVDLLKELQDEHNRARTRFAQVRDRNVPYMMTRKGVFSEEDLRQMANPDKFGIAQIEGTEGVPISQDIMVGINPEVNPTLYTTDHTERDWQRTSNVQDANNGFIVGRKTATESAIADNANKLQMSGDSDSLEDWLQVLFKNMLEILLQEMATATVVKICGAGAVWYERLPKEEIYNLVALEIVAGSTGKPEKEYEQRLWTQIGPQIIQIATQIGQFLQSSQAPLAKLMLATLKITMHKFDVRVDMDDLLKGLEQQIMVAEQGMTPEQQAQAQMQMQKTQAEADQAAADVQKTIADTEKSRSLAQKANAGAVQNIAEAMRPNQLN